MTISETRRKEMFVDLFLALAVVATITALACIPYRYSTLPRLLSMFPQNPHWYAVAAALMETISGLISILACIVLIAQMFPSQEQIENPRNTASEEPSNAIRSKENASAEARELATSTSPQRVISVTRDFVTQVA